MYAEDKYTLKPKAKKENMYLDGYGKHWGEKLTFTIGVAYCVSASLGLFAGVTRLRKNTMYTSATQSFSHIFGTVGRAGSEFGNSGASVTLLYCLIGGFIDLVFEEEVREYGYMARNVIAGGVTGGLYKSTLGLRPMIVGTLLGAGLITGVTYLTNILHDKNWIKFRIEV